MIEVIPTIIAKDFQELEEKIKKVEPYVDWAQLDIMDGQFVENSTWNSPADLKDFKTSLKLEAHLMIDKPEEHLDDWIQSGIKRIIFHLESTEQPKGVIEKIKGAGLEVGLAINPKTPIEALEPFLNVTSYPPEARLAKGGKLQVTSVLIMTVQPGQGGQKFLEETLPKIKNLREKYPYVNIGVDGGINLETAPKVIQAGANILASGSAIFESDDIAKTIRVLKSYENY